jgi:uncharacterized lipoprotein YbaY
MTAPIVVAAATAPTRTPVAIRESVIARKQIGLPDRLKGSFVDSRAA